MIDSPVQPELNVLTPFVLTPVRIEIVGDHARLATPLTQFDLHNTQYTSNPPTLPQHTLALSQTNMAPCGDSGDLPLPLSLPTST
jgi:hypothetical protein